MPRKPMRSKLRLLLQEPQLLGRPANISDLIRSIGVIRLTAAASAACLSAAALSAAAFSAACRVAECKLTKCAFERDKPVVQPLLRLSLQQPSALQRHWQPFERQPLLQLSVSTSSVSALFEQTLDHRRTLAAPSSTAACLTREAGVASSSLSSSLLPPEGGPAGASLAPVMYQACVSSDCVYIQISGGPSST